MRYISLFLLFSLLFFGSCQSKKTNSFRVEEINYPDSLHIVLRKNWGWKALQANVAEHKIKYITIHHGGEDFAPDQDPVAYIRHLQDWSRTTKKWIDIPYHFMIDLQGNIYETRPINYPGDTNTSYDPRGHALICMIGNFEHIEISPAQLNALVNLTAFLAQKYLVALQNIRGHKDYAETLCPGENLYRYLQDGTIQSRVAKILKRNE